MAEDETKDDVPKSITFGTVIMDVSCHPSRDLVAVGDIDGDVFIHSYMTSGSNSQLMSFTHHKKSCRCVQFSSDGAQLVTASKDKSISVIDMSSGSVKRSIKKAHESAIYCMLLVNENIVATGDDDGKLKVWDLRHYKSIMEMHESEEYLTDMVVDQTKRILLATSGEGTLSAFDIRKHKLVLQSELLDSALLSIAVVKNGSKVVCGSDEGVIDIFNWGEWGNISDRFPGHPMSIDTITPITDSIVCTGASDGVVRAVNILPNRIIGVVGRHDDGFPVEALSLSHCGRWLASCSHDQQVKFSDVRGVATQTVDGHKRLRRKQNVKALSSSAALPGAGFFDGLGGAETSSSAADKADQGSDLDSDGDDDDDSDIDDEDDDSDESEDDVADDEIVAAADDDDDGDQGSAESSEIDSDDDDISESDSSDVNEDDDT